MVPCFPLLGLTPSGLLMGSSSTLIYTSELILCSTICVPSATRHNIQCDKVLSKFGQQQLVMVTYACGSSQSERGKYFKGIIN